MIKFRLLLVDDEPNVLNSLKRCLGNPEYDIVTCDSPGAAMKYAKTGYFDLMICDYVLGSGENGVDLIKSISGESPDTVAILLTGHADLSVALEAINKVNLYKFIIKPWDNDDLKLTVKRALEQKALIQENKRLIGELKKKDDMIKEMEKKYPGITDVKRDDSGRVIIDEDK